MDELVSVKGKAKNYSFQAFRVQLEFFFQALLQVVGGVSPLND